MLACIGGRGDVQITGPQAATGVLADRKPRRSFMGAGELVRLRLLVLRATQEQVAGELVDPCTGLPLTRNALSHYERGLRPVPLWVARRVRDLAEAARAFDAGLLNRATS